MNVLGLSNEEVTKSRSKYGTNDISSKKKNSFFKLFLSSLGDPIIRILLIALAIKVLFLLKEFDWYETVGIAIAIFIASFISTVSEYGSEEAFTKLQEEASKIKSKVYRDNTLSEIEISNIVVGDYIKLQMGDKVPADGKIIDGNIYVNESALNGESKEALKGKEDYLYRGSVVCEGECIFKVDKVGNNTEYGKLAKELSAETRESPLKIKLRNLAKTISKYGYIGAFIVAISYLFDVILIENNFDLNLVTSYVKNFPILFGEILHAITLAVTVIVVAVPEGLPMMITVVLSANMKKMLKDNVLVRKLVGIETAGSINILFSDKTGTITKGNLIPVTFIDGSLKEQKNINVNNKQLRLLKENLYYNNAATFNDKKEIIGGNSTDRALLKIVENENIKEEKKETILPFNSTNKYSVVKYKNITSVKGAPEKVLPLCSYYYDENGEKKILNKKFTLQKMIKEKANSGTRFIAVAMTEGNSYTSNLTLVGVIGLNDEIRNEAKTAIKQVMNAGIKVIMLTGDAKESAVSIAKDAGFGIINEDNVLTSEELNKMNDIELMKKISNIKVISRALPSDKLRLVKVCQQAGLVVGMTGDGVNDAPALKLADVGFSMGTGTEVAKEASDIVILDNNFNSISKAVLYGRTIFKSIRKFIIFQLTVNICAVGLSVVGPFIGVKSPITVIQMLWVNMIMDSLAALAFAGEPPLKEYMLEKPKKRDENILNNYMLNQIFLTGIYSFLLCIWFLTSDFIKHYFRIGDNNIYLLTAFFALFIFVGIFNAFNARTNRLNFFANFLKNKSFIIIMVLISIIQIIMIYYGGTLFRTLGLTFKELVVVILLSSTVVVADFARKIVLKYHKALNGV